MLWRECEERWGPTLAGFMFDVGLIQNAQVFADPNGAYHVTTSVPPETPLPELVLVVASLLRVNDRPVPAHWLETSVARDEGTLSLRLRLGIQGGLSGLNYAGQRRNR